MHSPSISREAHTERSTEMRAQTDTRTQRATDEAMIGARRCLVYWHAEGDDTMVADAQSRIDRLQRGEATESDVLGAMDWYDALIDEVMAEWSEYTEDDEDYAPTDSLIADVVALVDSHASSVTDAVMTVVDAQ